ncbi:MAG: hypothetical protein EOO88_19685 [Pedobacter sp.]|nr:MAG: hypothetical protein EOO88_19685 [Pedobacter sp.]
MIRFCYLLLIFALSNFGSFAQQTPKIKVDVPASLKPYIPKGYEALELSKGDLNLDPYPDAILVLYRIGEEKTSDVTAHPQKRPLLLFIGQPKQDYQLVAQSNDVVYCVDCGGQMGDPFTGITIKRGYFSIEHYGGSGWRWTRIVTFKYSPSEKNWFLHRDGGDSFNAISHQEIKKPVRTVRDFGKVAFKKFNIYAEQSR